MEQLRAWLADLAGQMPGLLEWAAGVEYITEPRMAGFQAEWMFYANLLLLFDTGAAPDPSKMPPLDEDVARTFLDGVRHWLQREAESAGVILTSADNQDRRLRQAMLQRLRDYAARYPTVQE